MGKPYSVDLRVRVVAAVDGGESVDEVAERYAVTARTVWSWLAMRRETGSVEPRKGVVGPKPKLDKYREQIEATIKSSSSLTLSELQSKLKLPGGIMTLWRALARWGQSLKKSDVRS
jgi:transposase